MTFAQISARPLDRLKRLLFGSYVHMHNIRQCPRCCGTDKTRHVCEGFAVALYQCDRCDKEWWS